MSSFSETADGRYHETAHPSSPKIKRERFAEIQTPKDALVETPDYPHLNTALDDVITGSFHTWRDVVHTPITVEEGFDRVDQMVHTTLQTTHVGRFTPVWNRIVAKTHAEMIGNISRSDFRMNPENRAIDLYRRDLDKRIADPACAPEEAAYLRTLVMQLRDPQRYPFTTLDEFPPTELWKAFADAPNMAATPLLKHVIHDIENDIVSPAFQAHVFSTPDPQTITTVRTVSAFRSHMLHPADGTFDIYEPNEWSKEFFRTAMTDDNGSLNQQSRLRRWFCDNMFAVMHDSKSRDTLVQAVHEDGNTDLLARIERYGSG